MKRNRIIVIVLAFSLLGACSSAPDPKNAVPAPKDAPVNSNASPNVNSAESEKAKEDVVASTRKLKDLKFWTAKTEIENMPALSGEIKYVAPDRYYFKQGANEAIVVGDQTFTKENGKWQKSDFDMSGLTKIRENALTEEDVKKIQNVSVIGSETLNGRRTTVYAHRATSGTVESATRMWIDEETKLVMKTVVENRAGKQTQRVTTTYDFDTPVKIESPKIGS
ncbi:MAG: hypothetical protein IPJ30_02040 [Acidobacteria bacterium]|nr:hypothetical protein [Acidobacteriota bacterium]